MRITSWVVLTRSGWILDDSLGRMGRGPLRPDFFFSERAAPAAKDIRDCRLRCSYCSVPIFWMTGTSSWCCRLTSSLEVGELDCCSEVDVGSCDVQFVRIDMADVLEEVVVVVVVVVVVDDDADADVCDRYMTLFCEAKNDWMESRLTLLKFTRLIG